MKNLAIISILAIVNMVGVHAKSHISHQHATLEVSGDTYNQVYQDKHKTGLVVFERASKPNAIQIIENKPVLNILPASVSAKPVIAPVCLKRHTEIAEIDHAGNIYKTIKECMAISIALILSWVPIVYAKKSKKNKLVKQRTAALRPSGQLNEIGRFTQVKSYLTEIKDLEDELDAGGLWYSTEKEARLTRDSDMHAAADLRTNVSNISFSKLNEGELFLFRSVHGNEQCRVMEIVFQAGNSQVILAATDKGIYKSFDAGQNWFLKSKIAFNI
jgi:hypothetical protein